MPYKKLFSSLVFILLMFGCHKSGPYNLDTLNKLKSNQEADIFKDFLRNSNLSLNGHHWTALMKYNPEIRDIVVIELNEFNTEKNDRTIEEKATLFLNNYFFITNEKLKNLFNPNYIDAYYGPFNNKHKILIKLYDDIENKNEYHKFLYWANEGFLLLRQYHYFINDTICGDDHFYFTY